MKGDAMKVRTDIKFGWVRHLDMNLRFRIGLGADDSLWVPADFLGLKTPALEQLRQKYGAVVLIDIVDGRIYVDSRAVVLNCAKNASPMVLITLPRYFSTCSRTSLLWKSSVLRVPGSSSSIIRLKPTMSVNMMAASR